eukprot:CAMPEP_0206402382 /NCGR_PEP_ID=MMETSP0294-20121207/26936_1 /ASSEMBLY_ACC=CAM_ASM_000327 /TAXON_ID=39354 /ORGANISM="Heterosigma akashiwo, Strain CCMP2393" /LENGTH=152 /DNA_ID=CAMNT_0053859471 /DNA_START=287 /DNA_END=745 /DNA_ORIENTATION=-
MAKEGAPMAIKGALVQGSSWGVVGAAFSGFEGLSRLVRGSAGDQIDSLAASFCVGCCIARAEKSLLGIVQRGLTYVLFNLVFLSAMPKEKPTPLEDYIEVPLIDDLTYYASEKSKRKAEAAREMMKRKFKKKKGKRARRRKMKKKSEYPLLY